MRAPAATPVDVPGFESVVRIDLGETVAYLAIHLTVGGRSFGGVRIIDYPDEQAALSDACALASAMSRKLLLPGLAGGGAKTVVMRPERNREDVLRRLGAYIESLAGRYHCGGDLGFTAADHAALLTETSRVACADLGLDTAASVRATLEAACPSPARVAVQGLGAVGLPLAEGLRADGVDVVATDVRPVDGWDLVQPPDTILDEPCDVFAPCARGGVIDVDVAKRLRARVVCGGANNPLSDPAVADVLASRGIVYVPDFVSNVGASIRGVSAALGESDLVPARMSAVADLTRELLDGAASTGRTPLAIAVDRADAAIDAARG